MYDLKFLIVRIFSNFLFIINIQTNCILIREYGLLIISFTFNFLAIPCGM